jgi:hypothetical protein
MAAMIRKRLNRGHRQRPGGIHVRERSPKVIRDERIRSGKARKSIFDHRVYGTFTAPSSPSGVLISS